MVSRLSSRNKQGCWANKPAPTLFGDGGLNVGFGLVGVVRAGLVGALGVDVVEVASKPAPTLFGVGGELVFFGWVGVVRAGFVEALGVDVVEVGVSANLLGGA